MNDFIKNAYDQGVIDALEHFGLKEAAWSPNQEKARAALQEVGIIKTSGKVSDLIDGVKKHYRVVSGKESQGLYDHIMSLKNQKDDALKWMNASDSRMRDLLKEMREKSRISEDFIDSPENIKLERLYDEAQDLNTRAELEYPNLHHQIKELEPKFDYAQKHRNALRSRYRLGAILSGGALGGGLGAHYAIKEAGDLVDPAKLPMGVPDSWKPKPYSLADALVPHLDALQDNPNFKPNVEYDEDALRKIVFQQVIDDAVGKGQRMRTLGKGALGAGILGTLAYAASNYANKED